MADFNQPDGEVVSTATLECRTLPLCGSDTVLFGLTQTCRHMTDGHCNLETISARRANSEKKKVALTHFVENCGIHKQMNE